MTGAVGVLESAATSARASARRPVSVPLFRRSRRRAVVEIPGRSDVLALTGMLLTYPDDAFYAQSQQIGAVIAGLPDSAPAGMLREFWVEFTAMDEKAARAHYVDTFDLKRKSSLYLSYYLHGDTRQRGMALLALKQRYRACGFAPDEAELPDYLPMALEFAARAGSGVGEAPLRTHRAGIELIRRTLTENGSVYRLVLDAVATLLGPATDRQVATAGKLAAEGPPTDDDLAPTADALVPYGPPELTCTPKGF